MRKNTAIRGTVFLVCCLASATMLTSCEKDDSEAKISEKVKEFEAGIQKSSVDIGKNKGIVVGSVNMGMNGEWFAEVMNGIRDAASDLGVEVKMLDSESDVGKEADNIHQLLDEGIDTLVISPIDVDQSAVPINEVLDEGIPVVSWNTTVNTDVTASVGVIPDDLGAGAGEYACEYIKAHDLKNVNLMILENTTYEIGIGRCDGFRSAIQDMVDQGLINVVCTEEAEFRDQGKEVTEEALSEYSDIDMIWAWNQGALTGAADALKEMNESDIILLGVDMSMELADDMLGDKIDLEAVTTQLPYNMGYKAVVNAVEAAKGNKTEKNIWIPVSTYTKNNKTRLEQYKENHKDLVNE